MTTLHIPDSALVVDYTNDGWSEFKKWLDGTYAALHFVYADEGLSYEIVVADGPVYRMLSINKVDASDFENNYKSIVAQTSSMTRADGVMMAAICPCFPPSKTTVRESIIGSIAGGTSDDETFLIPDGENLLIMRFAGGSEHTSSNKVELFYDPNGNGTGMTLLRVGYNSDFDLQTNFTYAGDGTAKIRMRRTSWGSGSREVAGFWEGFY